MSDMERLTYLLHRYDGLNKRNKLSAAMQIQKLIARLR